MSPVASDVTLGAEFQAWNSAIESAKRVVSKTLEAVKTASKTTLPLPVRLWRAERELKSFVGRAQEFTGKLCSSIEGYRKVQSIYGLVEKMFDLSTSTENLYAIAKQKGYTNRTMTAASLNLIRDHGQQIFNTAESLGLILDPATDERFRLAREEQERGECVGMEVFN